eukprot:gnl/Hemi2/9589_TR3331_c0_g1_i1.p1 gnl/Hemi2/9589_TR3331_c0_g1~~gnl/Hemi2/9589_TR3331_c0_g1_i1.p1  ORF type:complete len:187 (+),score=32.75 gnl/Hemi2/9589_TR3331_c0_g1_i1:121-681(+)
MARRRALREDANNFTSTDCFPFFTERAFDDESMITFTFEDGKGHSEGISIILDDYPARSQIFSTSLGNKEMKGSIMEMAKCAQAQLCAKFSLPLPEVAGGAAPIKTAHSAEYSRLTVSVATKKQKDHPPGWNELQRDRIKKALGAYRPELREAYLLTYDWDDPIGLAKRLDPEVLAATQSNSCLIQ